jgi:hemerythrin-like domain-containing protein
MLDRILLIYENCTGRLERGEELPAGVLNGAAQIVRDFIEKYHEQLEESYVFPEFEKRKQLADLVQTLKRQHDAGRGLTRDIIALSSGKAVDENRKVIADIREFIRMYRPHKAREDTVLFPAFHALLPPAEYAHLGDLFEAKETELFGEGGFGKMVERVAALEKQLNISDLRQFTPGRRGDKGAQ